MYQTPRAATVKAKESAILWAVDRKTFRRVLLVSILQRRKMFEEFLSSVPLLDAMSSYETSNLCDALRSRTLVSGDTVYKEGEPGEGTNSKKMISTTFQLFSFFIVILFLPFVTFS